MICQGVQKIPCLVIWKQEIGKGKQEKGNREREIVKQENGNRKMDKENRKMKKGNWKNLNWHLEMNFLIGIYELLRYHYRGHIT